MISNKPRPADGPGSNGLRGGKKAFSGRTALGGWLDDVGGPIGYQRGFSSGEYQTESQNQQLGVVVKPPPLYGAALYSSAGKKAPTVADNFGTTSKDEWKTSTMVMSEALKQPNPESYVPASSLRGEELEKYRQTWTLDSAVARSVRYTTESRRAANAAPEAFRVASVRLLPGTPKPVERFRDRLLEKYGILGISALRYHLGSGVISCSNFRASLSKLDIKLSPSEFSQIVAYFTASETFNADDLVRTLVARIDGFDRQYPEELFLRLFGDVGAVSLDEVAARVSEEVYREAAIGLRLYLPAYARQGYVITTADFLTLHIDLFSSAPSSFKETVPNLWTS